MCVCVREQKRRAAEDATRRINLRERKRERGGERERERKRGRGRDGESVCERQRDKEGEMRVEGLLSACLWVAV